MRIIAGTLGSRVFESPHGHRTHPMGDKIRGALFNMLGDMAGLTVLDAFAGSGALGFEAMSRGAKSVVAVEIDKSAQITIAKNKRQLGLDRSVQLIKASANAWLQTAGDPVFDIVLLDPPYDDLQLSLLQRLADCVAADGVLVLSWPGDQPLPDFATFDCVTKRSYGDAQLGFYQQQT